jgi:two-component system CheB/CheR fusion protein
VLVVDDNVDSAMGMAEVLKLWGYSVETAYDGHKAVEAASSQRPDVVLLDIGLPGMDGYETARSMRQQPGLDAVVLVALTGYGQEQDKTRAQQAGFAQHFTKPVDLQALRRFLASRSA